MKPPPRYLDGGLTACCIAAVAVLCVAFSGGISVGTSNHVGLLPVVRRLLDPSYLPGDFNIALRNFHHRIFANVLAALSMLLGEARAVIALHVTAAALSSWALWFLCRTLGLGRLAFLALGIFLATGFAWTGFGLEENTFVGGPEVQPPMFAHAFVLLAAAFLIRKRYRAAAYCTGVTVLFHVQIGLIATMIVAPFYVARLRDSNWRELAETALAYLVPASPAFIYLLAMVRNGLLQAGDTYPLGYYIDLRQRHHFALMSARHACWVTAHVGLQAALWLWLVRARRDEARAIGVMLALSTALAILALLHFADYYLVKADEVASLQAIRLSPVITVFGAASFVWLANVWARESPARRWLAPAVNSVLLALGVAWGTLVATRQDTKVHFGLERNDNPADHSGSERRWVELCNWIKTNTPPDAVFLTPPALEGFTSLTDRSNIVEFKINPDGGLLAGEWLRRLKDSSGGTLPEASGYENWELLNESYGKLTSNQLRALGRKYGASYAVLPKSSTVSFEVVRENASLKLVRLP